MISKDIKNLIIIYEKLNPHDSGLSDDINAQNVDIERSENPNEHVHNKKSSNNHTKKKSSKEEDSLFKSGLKYGSGFTLAAVLTRDLISAGEQAAKTAVSHIGGQA